MSSFWQFFDIQLAIFRRVRSIYVDHACSRRKKAAGIHIINVYRSVGNWWQILEWYHKTLRIDPFDWNPQNEPKKICVASNKERIERTSPLKIWRWNEWTNWQARYIPLLGREFTVIRAGGEVMIRTGVKVNCQTGGTMRGSYPAGCHWGADRTMMGWPGVGISDLGP